MLKSLSGHCCAFAKVLKVVAEESFGFVWMWPYSGRYRENY